jgi:hypothetical protein
MPLKLNSTSGGSVTLQEPTTASNRTLTLPDNTGTVLSTASTFAGTGPAFSAYYSGAGQTVSASTNTKVILNQETFDTNSNFDSTTNYRFTPTVAGYYQISGIVRYSTSSTFFLQNVANVSIWKNGSGYRLGTQNTIGGASYTAFSVSDVVYLNGSTDYVELYTAHNYSPNLVTLGSDSGIIATYFSGSMVRAA